MAGRNPIAKAAGIFQGVQKETRKCYCGGKNEIANKQSSIPCKRWDK